MKEESAREKGERRKEGGERILWWAVMVLVVVVVVALVFKLTLDGMDVSIGNGWAMLTLQTTLEYTKL